MAAGPMGSALRCLLGLESGRLGYDCLLRAYTGRFTSRDCSIFLCPGTAGLALRDYPARLPQRSEQCAQARLGERNRDE
ncbi:hypothetical protein D3C72_1707720 [compost metagenome]